MKKILVPILALICMIGFYSCQKELSYASAGTGSTTTGATGTFRAKINGIQWEANTIKYASIQQGVIFIYGYNAADKKNMLLRVADSGVHNYSFNTNSASNAGAYTDSMINPFAFVTNQFADNADHGIMNVTKIDSINKLISGTFKMDVTQSLTGLVKTITDGVFTDISYATTTPPPSTTDTFRVKIDGTDFSYNLLAGVSALGMISVTASANSGSGATVGLTMPSTAVPGNYAFDFVTYAGQYNPTSSTFLIGDTGHLQIIEHNVAGKRIRGNFSFKAAPLVGPGTTAQLTEGYFSVKYN